MAHRFRERWASVLLLFIVSAGLALNTAGSPIYGVFVGSHRIQSGEFFIPDPFGKALFEIWVRDTVPYEVQSTSVASPSGAQRALTQSATSAFYQANSISPSQRDVYFPPGNYTLTEELTSGGTRSTSLSLSPSGAPPPPKFIVNGAWEEWPRNSDLEVRWEAGAGTLPSDVFVVTLRDEAGVAKTYESPYPGQPGALSGTATSLIIPGAWITNDAFNVEVSCYRPSGTLPTLTGEFAGTLYGLTVVGEISNPVAYHHVVKGRVFAQTNNNAPVLLSSNAYVGEALLVARYPTQLGDVTIQASDNPQHSLVQLNDEAYWRYSSVHNAAAELDSAWPAATYEWEILQPLGGTQTSDQNVSAFQTVSPLRILNLDAVRSSSFDNDVSLSWATEGPVSASDHIEFTVTTSEGEVVLHLPDLKNGSQLPGNATSLTIKGGSLPSDTNLVCALRYLHVNETGYSTFEDALDISASFAETRFTLNTLAAQKPVIHVVTTTLDALPAGKYAEQYLAAIGGVRPHRWSLIGGTLPSGLALATNGLIRGIPMTAGVYDFSVRVSDASTNSSEQALSLSITGSIPQLYIATTNLPTAQAPWRYLAELSSGGGVYPFKWAIASGNLPPGIELLPDQGILTGMPQKPGTFPFSVKLTDAASTVREAALSLTVLAPEPLASLSVSPTLGENPGTIKLTLNAEVGDSVSFEHSRDLVHWDLALATDYPGPDGVTLTPAADAVRFYRARWGRTPTPANPAGRVTPVLQDGLAASGHFSPMTNLSLTLTNGSGHVYSLEIPSNALPYEVDIQMQFVAQLGNSPFSNSYYGVVELRPGGLRFERPAQLTVTFPGAVPANYTPVAYESGGWNPRLAFAQFSSNRVIFPIFHFSGAGGTDASGSDANGFDQQHQPCPQYAGEQRLGNAVRQARQQAAGSNNLDTAQFIPAMKEWWDTSVWPGVKAGQGDIGVFDYALAEYLRWLRCFELLGLPEAAAALQQKPSNSWTAEDRILMSLMTAINTKAPKALAVGYANAIVETHIRCVTERDAWVAWQMIEYARGAALLGLDSLLPSYLSLEAVLERLGRVWRFEIKLDSVVEVITAQGNFVSQVVSERCPIELDPNTAEGALGMLQKGFSKPTRMVSWELISPGGELTRPVPSEGRITTHHLSISPIYPEKTGAEPPDSECQTPSARPYPVDAKITMLFDATDPVKTKQVFTPESGWISMPVGGSSWEYQIKTWHDRAVHGSKADFLFFSKIQWPNKPAPIDSFLPSASLWQYSGGEPFADIPYSSELSAEDGEYTERTVLELFFAPLPLRDSDTDVPPPSS